MDNITIVNSASVNDSISILGLIGEADFVVQLVMLILVMLSIYSWTIIFSKKKVLLDSKSDIKNFSKCFSTDKALGRIAISNTK